MTISLTKSETGTWIDESERKITLPPNVDPNFAKELTIPVGSAVAFIGPNGAGKSRMAAWIDKNNSDIIYIRARRSIVMPAAYKITPEEAEYTKILSGQSLNKSQLHIAKAVRYSENHDGYSDNDFESVLNILGSRHATSALKFRANYNPDLPPKEAPASELDQAIRIWRELLPHLNIDATNAPQLLVSRAEDEGRNEFEPKEMSDGEKAIFYLVAKCLILPSGSTVLIDEPEMYVHRSIRSRLWNSIERRRKDCAFMYFTHDLNFVRNRRYSSVINVRAYINSPESWDYVDFVPDDNADEILQMSVWGSRQPTLLVEGDRGSLDFRILSLAYPGVAVEPAGSCRQVIDGVAALRRQKRFHHQAVFGLIDADFRLPSELSSLSRKGVLALRFREIENVLVCRAVLERFADHFRFSKKDFAEIEDEITSILRSRVGNRSTHASSELSKRFLVNLVEDRVMSGAELSSLDKIVSAVDFSDAVSQGSEKYESIRSGGIDDILSLFSVRKDGLGDIFSKAFKLKDFSTYSDAVLRLASDEDDGSGILRAIRTQLPTIRFP